MTNFAAAAEYLQAAADENMLYDLPGLGQYVAGDFTTPTGTSLLVEYCEAHVLTDGGERLLRSLRAHFPGTRHVQLRTTAAVELTRPWFGDLTYLCHEGAPPAAPPSSVRRSGPHEDALIRAWLVQALRSGADVRGKPADSASLDAAAGEILANEGRESWVWMAEGVPVGHATLQTNAYDAVTATSYVELEDILIDPPYQRSAMGDLVAACVHRSAQLGLPLVGNVVHAVSDPDASEQVIAKLEGRGWRPDYRIWRCDLTAV
ncbi:GNAT family N-acetyltransferase [Streptomyces tendae]|uniref:hypothetical protein n=1 Tax=Streptomyces tendae TaxID=1932 RepID=UPI0036806CD2